MPSAAFTDSRASIIDVVFPKHMHGNDAASFEMPVRTNEDGNFIKIEAHSPLNPVASTISE
jgi:hypothetical protein